MAFASSPVERKVARQVRKALDRWPRHLRAGAPLRFNEYGAPQQALSAVISVSIIPQMRKTLLLSDAKLGDLELGWWHKIMQRLADLPCRDISIGWETKFASWLSQDHIEWIQKLTKDELSQFLTGSPRDLEIFRRRLPSERFIQLALEMPLDNMTPATLEDHATICSGMQRQKIRSFRNFSSADSRGASQEFVAPAHVPRAVEEFCSAWNEARGLEHRPIAIWLFVSLLNTHPFGDSNGRLARSLLNVRLLGDGLLNGQPIPFGPLIYATQGNFELAMGRAAIMNKWEPIIKVFYLLIDFYADAYGDFERVSMNG